MVDVPHTFGERLKWAMAHKRPKAASLSEVAHACGVSYQGAKKWLDASEANLDATNALAISKFLGVAAEWLVNGVGAAYNDAPTQTAPSTQEPVASYGTKPGAEFVLAIEGFLGALSPLLRPAAVQVIKKLLDEQMKPDEALSDLGELLAMSELKRDRKQTGTG